MALETYLLIVAPTFPDNRPATFDEFRYIPLSCEPDALQKTVNFAANKSPDMQVIGVVSKEMVVGMLKTIEDFETSRL